MELARALAKHVECKLVTFGSRAESRREGRLEVTVLKRTLPARGHPAHPLPHALLSELDGGDIVHAHHLRALPSRVAAIGAWVQGRRRVVTDHGLGPGRGPKVVARIFDHFLTVSQYSAQTLRAPTTKTTVVYAGADTQRFRPHPGVTRSGVLYVGRLTPHKGVDRLIQALPAGAALTIAGTRGHDRHAPERDYPALLERLAEGRDVRFVTAPGEDDLGALYRRAQVLVLPSVRETCYGKRVAIPELLGLSLLEAMASATPVIATRVGGLPEVVVDGRTGFVVEPGAVDELHARLELLLGDERTATDMGDSARRHVVEHFTWDRCAQRCLDVYESLLGAA